MKKLKSLKFLIYIFSGLSLIVVRLIDYHEDWSVIDILKLVFGLFAVVYGVTIGVSKKNRQ
jgi:hypothetical protein